MGNDHAIATCIINVLMISLQLFPTSFTSDVLCSFTMTHLRCTLFMTKSIHLSHHLFAMLITTAKEILIIINVISITSIVEPTRVVILQHCPYTVYI